MLKTTTFLFLLLSGNFVWGQTDHNPDRWLQRNNPLRSKGTPITSAWHTGSAGIIKSDGAELSLFNTSRVGMTKNTELLFRIGEEWILPNAGIKHRWLGKERFILSTEHILYYTWPFLKILQSTGVKDLIPDSVSLKQGIAMRNELLFSWLMNPKVLGCPDPSPERILTLRAGVEFYAGGSNKGLYPFDWFHSLYHTQVFKKKLLYYGGLQFDSYFSNRFHYSINALYYNPGLKKDYAIEGNARLTYYISRKVGISVACKGAYIKIPEYTGNPDQLYVTDAKFSVLPFLDLTLLIRPDRGELQHGLFKKPKKRR